MAIDHLLASNKSRNKHLLSTTNGDHLVIRDTSVSSVDTTHHAPLDRKICYGGKQLLLANQYDSYTYERIRIGIDDSFSNLRTRPWITPPDFSIKPQILLASMGTGWDCTHNLSWAGPTGSLGYQNIDNIPRMVSSATALMFDLGVDQPYPLCKATEVKIKVNMISGVRYWIWGWGIDRNIHPTGWSGPYDTTDNGPNLYIKVIGGNTLKTINDVVVNYGADSAHGLYQTCMDSYGLFYSDERNAYDHHVHYPFEDDGKDANGNTLPTTVKQGEWKYTVARPTSGVPVLPFAHSGDVFTNKGIELSITLNSNQLAQVNNNNGKFIVYGWFVPMKFYHSGYVQNVDTPISYSYSCSIDRIEVKTGWV